MLLRSSIPSSLAFPAASTLARTCLIQAKHHLPISILFLQGEINIFISLSSMTVLCRVSRVGRIR